MPDITLSLDEDLLKASRKYAQERNTSLNALVRDLLAREIGSGDTAWSEDLTDAMSRSTGDSGGRPWKREDLFEAPS